MIRFGGDARVVHCDLDDLLGPEPGLGPPAPAELPIDAVVEWNGLEVHVSARIAVVRSARGDALPELVRIADPAKPEAGRARAIERAGFCALLLRRSGTPARRARLIERAPDGAELGRIEIACAERSWSARFAERDGGLRWTTSTSNSARSASASARSSSAA